MDKPTNALSWGRKPAVFTKLIELTQRLFEDRPATSHLFRPAWEDDGTTKILFGVVGLIRCRVAFDRQGDVFLRFELGGINGAGSPYPEQFTKRPVVKLREGVDSALPRSMYLCRLRVVVSA